MDTLVCDSWTFINKRLFNQREERAKEKHHGKKSNISNWSLVQQFRLAGMNQNCMGIWVYMGTLTLYEASTLTLYEASTKEKCRQIYEVKMPKWLSSKILVMVISLVWHVAKFHASAILLLWSKILWFLSFIHLNWFRSLFHFSWLRNYVSNFSTT